MSQRLPPPLNLGQNRPLHEQAQVDGLALPHVFSFATIVGGANQVYWHDRYDEAMRHCRENALVMRHDAFLMSLLQERKFAVSSLPWYLEVPDPRDPLQAKTRASMTQALRGVRGFRRMIWQWLEALWHGRSGVQFAWRWQEIDGRRALAVEQWSPIQGDKIGYHWDNVPYVLVNTSKAAHLPTIELVNTTVARALRLSGGWRERFVIHQHSVEDADFFEGEAGDALHGVGIRSYVYWLDYLKREYLSHVVNYLERVGLGVSLWKYDASDPTAKAKAEAAAVENSGRVNITVPVWPDSRGGMTGGLERVEVPTAGVGVLREMIGAMDQYIERFVVGQTGSAHSEASGLGNEAASEFKSNTKDAIRDHDAHMLAETITGDDKEPGMLSLMQRYSYPETCPDRPNGFPVMFRFGLERSLNNERVKTILMLVEKGLPVKKDDLYNAAGVSRPEPHDDVIAPPPLPVPGGPGAPAHPGQPGTPPRPPAPGGPGPDRQPQPQPQPGAPPREPRHREQRPEAPAGGQPASRRDVDAFLADLLASAGTMRQHADRGHPLAYAEGDDDVSDEDFVPDPEPEEEPLPENEPIPGPRRRFGSGILGSMEDTAGGRRQYRSGRSDVAKAVWHGDNNVSPESTRGANEEMNNRPYGDEYDEELDEPQQNARSPRRRKP